MSETPEPQSTDIEGRPEETGPLQLSSVVGLGGSAGGIVALQEFLRLMPVETGMAFVVIIHLPPEYESALAEVLQRSTRMPVTQIVNGDPIEPNRVYLIPPGKNLTIEEGRLMIADFDITIARRLAVDLFFRNLAEV